MVIPASLQFDRACHEPTVRIERVGGSVLSASSVHAYIYFSPAFTTLLLSWQTPGRGEKGRGGGGGGGTTNHNGVRINPDIWAGAGPGSGLPWESETPMAERASHTGVA